MIYSRMHHTFSRCLRGTGWILDRLKIRAFRCSVHTESLDFDGITWFYENLDAQSFKVPCEQSKNIERSRGELPTYPFPKLTLTLTSY